MRLRVRRYQRLPVVLVRGWDWNQLPMAPRVRCFGYCWRHAWLVDGRTYDFEPDVRELILEEVRNDVWAMWSDPRERLR